VDEYVAEFTNYPNAVIHFDQTGKKLHPTQKPVELLRYLIRTYTDEGMLVLDNCSGSGSTAIACIRENRNYIGFELNEDYYNSSISRIKTEMSQPRLF
jgi:site-specific DNA-methyltransferase (adenine-specific)